MSNVPFLVSLLCLSIFLLARINVLYICSYLISFSLFILIDSSPLIVMIDRFPFVAISEERKRNNFNIVWSCRMTRYNDYFFYIINFFILFIKINGLIKNYKFEQQLGSTIVLPPCLLTQSSSNDNVTVRKSLLLIYTLKTFSL